jgi:hypothetical protein
MAQMPLYKGMPFAELSSWLICFRASLGDALIVITIWGIGALVYRNVHWFRPLHAGPALLLIFSGVVIAVLIEWHALANERWAYSGIMPVVPILGVGLSPLVQLLLLPWPTMMAASR